MTYAAEVLADTPLVHLRFNDTSGTNIEDATANNRDGTWIVTPTLGVAGLLQGDTDKAADLNGSTNYGRIFDTGFLNGLTAFTVEAIIRPDVITGSDRAIAEQNDGYSNLWELDVTAAGKVRFRVWDTGGTAHTYTGATTLVAGQTYYVMATHSGTAQRIYVKALGEDFIVDATGSDTFTKRNAAVTLAFGASLYLSLPSVSRYYDGVLDELAIYGTALSQARGEAHALAFDPPAPLSLDVSVDDATHTVQLVAANGTPPYTITAHPERPRTDYVVRSPAGSVSGDPDARAFVDGDVPLNVPTYYTVVDSAGTPATATSDTVTVTAALPVLSDSLDPTRALDVVVRDQLPNSWEARSVWWDVLEGPPFPSVAPMRLRNGQLVLRTETLGERLALIGLFSSGRPLLLRSTDAETVDDVVALPERVDEQLVDDTDKRGARWWVITYQAVSRDPLDLYVVTPGRTYDDLPADFATYDELRDAFATYDNLAAGL